jgi:hypothetical protein
MLESVHDAIAKLREQIAPLLGVLRLLARRRTLHFAVEQVDLGTPVADLLVEEVRANLRVDLLVRVCRLGPHCSSTKDTPKMQTSPSSRITKGKSSRIGHRKSEDLLGRYNIIHA